LSHYINDPIMLIFLIGEPRHTHRSFLLLWQVLQRCTTYQEIKIIWLIL
jgi:hypothetical protein